MTVLSNIITPSNVLTTTNTATVTNKTLTSPTVTGMVVSDGTANGVTYLNGSKVLTSGSALTFDGTNFAVVGGNATINRSTNTSRLTLGGSPSANWEGDIQFVTSNTQTNWRVSSNQVTSGAFTITPSTAGGGSTFTTPAVTIDNASNLGLGVTPSAWGALRGFDITAGAALAGANNLAYLTGNCYFNGTNWIYKAPAKVAVQETGDGFVWKVAASGTAGNTISFTQALTLTAAGDLCVGATSSTSSRLFSKGANTGSSEFALRVHDSADTVLFYVRNDGYTQTGGGANSPYNLTTASAANLWVGSNGELRRSTSSLKYKTDVQDATHGLAEVLTLRPVTYKGKNDGDTVFGGLIAEEVHEAGLTEFVQYAEDGTPDALAYGQMVSLCIKAIQELKAEFDAYKVSHP